MTPPRAERILAIKLGALGDVVQSLGPLAAIRAAHPGAELVVLTSAPFSAFYAACPGVDRVETDPRADWRRPLAWLSVPARIKAGGFSRVYDLQTSGRTSRYFLAMRVLPPWGRMPEWSGIAPGCSHPHANPGRNAMHTLDRQADQLRMAGIPEVPPPDVSWLAADVSGLDPGAPFVLLLPGGSPERPGKRWPAALYADFAARLADSGILPVLLGTAADAGACGEIAARVPAARNLCGRTSLAQVAALARRAAGAVGDDCGPMHLAAAAGCPALVLFGPESDPALCAPRGARVAVLSTEILAALTPQGVWDAWKRLVPVAGNGD